MAEFCFGMFAEVALDALPVVLIIAYMLAVGTNWENALQYSNLPAGVCKFNEASGQLLL